MMKLFHKKQASEFIYGVIHMTMTPELDGLFLFCMSDTYLIDDVIYERSFRAQCSKFLLVKLLATHIVEE